MKRARQIPVLLSLSVLTIMLRPDQGQAIWAAMELTDAVVHSDVIVEATLEEVSHETRLGIEHSQGYLRVQAVVWGDVNASQQLLLRWQNEVNIVCPRVSHVADGTARLWLLTRNADGSFAANHPDLERPLTDRADVDSVLATCPLLLGASERREEERTEARLVFRNATGHPIDVPGVELDGANVICGPGLSIAYSSWVAGKTEPGQWRADHMRSDSTLAPVRLRPGEIRLVVIPLPWRPVTTQGRGHVVMVDFQGRRFEHRWHTEPRWATRLQAVRGTPDEAPYYVQMLQGQTEGPGTDAVISMMYGRREVVGTIARDLTAAFDTLATFSRLQVLWMVCGSDATLEDQADLLMHAISGPDSSLRAAAIVQAGSVLSRSRSWDGAEPLYDEILRFLDDEDPIMRRSACGAVGSLGTRGWDAHARVEMMIKYDGDAEVREAAKQAVDAIEGRSRCCCQPKLQN